MKTIEELMNTIEIRQGTLNYLKVVVKANRTVANMALDEYSHSVKLREQAKSSLREAKAALAQARLKAKDYKPFCAVFAYPKAW